MYFEYLLLSTPVLNLGAFSGWLRCWGCDIPTVDLSVSGPFLVQSIAASVGHSPESKQRILKDTFYFVIAPTILFDFTLNLI